MIKKIQMVFPFIFVFCLIILGIRDYVINRQVILHIGVYSDSSWNVPNGNEYKIIDKVIADFEKDYPNVKVEYESGVPKSKYTDWLSDKLVLGQEPDVFIVPEEDFNLLASTGTLKDLSNAVVSDLDSEAFYKSSLLAGEFNTRQLALPFESNPMLMCFNKELLEKEGIELPKSGWTLSEFYQICQKVTKDTDGDGIIDQFGVTGYTWQQAVAAYGVPLFNEEGTRSNLSEKAIKDALSLWVRLTDLTAPFNVTSDDFDQGKVAFIPMTLAQYRTYKPYPYHVAKYSSFEWTCVPMPSVDGKLNASQVPTSLFGISSRTKESKLAWELLKRLSINQEVQKEVVELSQGSSVLKSVVLDQDITEWLQEGDLGSTALTIETLNEVLTDAQISPKFREYTNVMEKTDYLITNSLTNKKISTELSDIQRQIEEELTR